MKTDCKTSCPTEALNQEEAKKEFATLNKEWVFDSNNPNKISREFKFKNFAEALKFTNQVGALAEEINHHPDIILKWGLVQIELWTHKANGLTYLDFQLARDIDSI